MRELSVIEIEVVHGGLSDRKAGRAVGKAIAKAGKKVRKWADGVVEDYLRWRGIIV